MQIIICAEPARIRRGRARSLRLLAFLNNMTAGSSTQGPEPNPDDRRGQEERRKERKKKKRGMGPLVTCRACRAVFSGKKKKRQTGVCEPHLE